MEKLEQWINPEYYHEFGLFNNGTIIVSPVHGDSPEEILLSLKITGVGDFSYTSTVALISRNTSKRVYKGVCRYGSSG